MADIIILNPRRRTVAPKQMMTANAPEYPWLDYTQCIGADVFDSGWRDLLLKLFEDIDAILAGTSATLYPLQIKEKFGSLRFYRQFEGASPSQEEHVTALV